MRCVRSMPTTKLPKTAMDRQEHHSNGTPGVPDVPCDATYTLLLSSVAVQVLVPKDVFSKLTKFSENCHLANDWTCFVEHRLQHSSDSSALVVFWYSSGLISQRLRFKSKQRWGNFLISKNYLCKLPIGNKLQLGKYSNV